MLAEILIFVPSVARFVKIICADRLEKGADRIRFTLLAQDMLDPRT